MERGFNIVAYGQYHWQVLDGKSKKIIDQADRKHNHIFSGGLDLVADYTWADCFRICRLGNQPAPTGSAGSYEAVYGPNLQSEVDGPYGISSPSYYFSGFVEAVSGIGNFSGCETYATGSGLLMRRTFDFPEHPVGSTSELPPSGYTEIGWSPVSGGDLFSRVITTGDLGLHTPILVYEGQFVRIIYELTVYIGPSGETVASDIITGWNSAGQAGIQLLGLSSVDREGNSTFWDSSSGANEPSVYAGGFLSNANDDLATFGDYVDRSTGEFYQSGLHIFDYIPGQFSRTKRLFVVKDSGNFTGYNSIGLGNIDQPAKYNSYVHKFDNPVNKENNYIVNAKFNFSWSSLT